MISVSHSSIPLTLIHLGELIYKSFFFMVFEILNLLCILGLIQTFVSYQTSGLCNQENLNLYKIIYLGDVLVSKQTMMNFKCTSMQSMRSLGDMYNGNNPGMTNKDF